MIYTEQCNKTNMLIILIYVGVCSSLIWWYPSVNQGIAMIFI